MRDLLENSDVLLSLPDPLVFNSGTIHHLLVATYHQKIPVIGFSRAFVEAGALLAVYSTPAQTGRQAAEIVQQVLRTPVRALPPPQYPKYFAIAVNRRVAASLGLEVPDEQTLLNRLLGHSSSTMKTWGIKSRVIFLSLLPASLSAVMLGLYLMNAQISFLESAVHERGQAIARQLAPACEYGVFAGNRAILESLARGAS